MGKIRQFLLFLIILTISTRIVDIRTSRGQPDDCWLVDPSSGWTKMCSTPITKGTCGSSGTANGTCFVAVANSGSSSCSAHKTRSSAIAAPCNTIARGIAQLRRGASDDWLMLNRGDTFTDQDFDALCAQHGNSAADPLVITNYGVGARPIIEGPQNGKSSMYISSGAGGCGAGGDYIAFVGLHMYNHRFDPSNENYSRSSTPERFSLFNHFYWFLVEDCYFDFVFLNIDGHLNRINNTNFIVRRSVIADTYSSSAAHAQNLYMDATDEAVFFEDVWDHGGWNAIATNGGPTVFNHNVYIQCDPLGGSGCSGPVTVQGNFFSNDASGSQFRSGGVIQYNAFILSPYGANLGLPYNAKAMVSYNIFQFQMDQGVNNAVLSADEEATFSAYHGKLFNLGTVTIADNLFSHSITPNTNGGAILIDSGQTPSHVAIKNNIACDWLANSEGISKRLLIVDHDKATESGSYQKPSDCNNGSWTDTQPMLIDPNRTPGSYCARISCSRASARFVGSISSGLLTVSSISGTLHIGDAIVYKDQLMADFIKSFGSGTGAIGTYKLAGIETQPAAAMSSYTAQQLVTAMRENNKEAGWNDGLTACEFAKYIQAGFGVANPCIP